MDAVDQFFSIERTLQRLQLYEDRLSRLFFAKALRDRQLARVKRRWRQLSDARSHTLAVINANPHLKQRLERLQSERLKAASPPDISDAALIAAAQDLAAWRNREREAKDAFQDAVAFVKWGQDQAIPRAEAEAIREQLRTVYSQVRHQRLQRQVTFEAQYSRRYTDAARAIHERELALQAAHEAAAAATTPETNMFAQWYQRRTGQMPPERQTGKSAQHALQRRRQRDDDRSS